MTISFSGNSLRAVRTVPFCKLFFPCLSTLHCSDGTAPKFLQISKYSKLAKLEDRYSSQVRWSWGALHVALACSDSLSQAAIIAVRPNSFPASLPTAIRKLWFFIHRPTIACSSYFASQGYGLNLFWCRNVRCMLLECCSAVRPPSFLHFCYSINSACLASLPRTCGCLPLFFLIWFTGVAENTIFISSDVFGGRCKFITSLWPLSAQRPSWALSASLAMQTAAWSPLPAARRLHTLCLALSAVHW